MSYTIEQYLQENGDTLAVVMDENVIVGQATAQTAAMAVARAKQNTVMLQSQYPGFTSEEEAEILSAPVVVDSLRTYGEYRGEVLTNRAA